MENLISMKKYLFDSNSFMMPARNYYNFNILPTYWDRLLKYANKNNNLYVLSVVEDEINAGRDDDALKLWFAHNESNFKKIQHSTSEVIAKYTEVMQYIQHCGFYNNKGLLKWSDIKIADPWLIAAAKVYDLSIVTFEVRDGGLSLKNQTGSIKIPDVADHFGVESLNLYAMMEEIGIKI